MNGKNIAIMAAKDQCINEPNPAIKCPLAFDHEDDMIYDIILQYIQCLVNDVRRYAGLRYARLR